MINLPSKYSKEELIKRWDTMTSPARFAGSDDTMDLIFISKRKEDKVRIIRRARSATEPFSCVFRGRIKETEEGSAICGNFMKSVFDYCLILIVNLVLFYIRQVIIERGDSPYAINLLIMFGIIGGILLLLNSRATKRKYTDFLVGITGTPVELFLSKKEIEEREGQNNK